MNRFNNSSLNSSKKIDISIVFDRDGIINIPVEDLKNPDQFKVIDNTLESISTMRKNGARIFIIFNQPSIAKKTVSIEQVENVNSKLMELLGKAGCMSIDGLFYSTSEFKEDIMSLPNTGMLKKAEQECKIKIKGGYIVSDDIAHLKAGEKYNMKPVLILTGNGKHTLEKLNTFANRKLKQKTKVFSSLNQFTDFLLQ